MNCHAVKSWLLTAKAGGPLPVRLVRHLSDCSVCRSLYRQLLDINEMTDRLFAPADNPTARQALEARLNALPREVPWSELTAPPPFLNENEEPEPEGQPDFPAPFQGETGQRFYGRRRRRVGLRSLAACAAALLLVGFGWLLGRETSTPAGSVAQSGNGREADQRANHNPVKETTTPLIVRVAALAPRLTGGADPAARLDVMLALADELRSEGLRLAAIGQVDELHRLANLYERVLREGVIGQAQLFPEGKQKSAAIARLMKKMNDDAAEVAARQSAAPPSIARRLEPLAASARDASRFLAAGMPSELLPVKDAANPPPLDGLVALALRLSREDAPLPRAKTSAELAQALAHATVLLNVAGRTEYSTKMGEYLDTVMGAGVADNLDRAEDEDTSGTSQDEIAEVRARAGGVVQVFEVDLPKVDPEAQKGLQEALEASRPGQERAAQAGKGNGREGRPDFMPKGKDKSRWQKKKN